MYKGLDIVTAKVTPAERQMAPHHMLDIVDPLNVDFGVLNFREMALPIVIPSTLSSFSRFSCYLFGVDDRCFISRAVNVATMTVVRDLANFIGSISI